MFVNAELLDTPIVQKFFKFCRLITLPLWSINLLKWVTEMRMTEMN